MFEQAEDYILIPRKPYPSVKAKEAHLRCTEFPSTPEGDKAALEVFEAIGRLHQASLNDIDGIFKTIRAIFESFKIKINI